MEEHNISRQHTSGSRGVGHETTDVNIWAIGKFGIALVIITLLSVGLLIGVFRFFNARENREAKAVDPVKLFPTPRLIPDEPKNLAAFHAEEEKTLTTYGWVDQSKGVVRIPVDQAMDLLVKRGLPVRQQAAPVSGVSMPTESGLGQRVAAAQPEHQEEKANK